MSTHMPRFAKFSKIELDLLFDNPYINGDQAGGISPYTTIYSYPDGRVNYKDSGLVNSKYGKMEDAPEWNYLADIHPSRKIDYNDLGIILANYGKSGSYSTNIVEGIMVRFSLSDDSGAWITPDPQGFITLPVPKENITSYMIYNNTVPIGAFVTLWDFPKTTFPLTIFPDLKFHFSYSCCEEYCENRSRRDCHHSDSCLCSR